MSVVMGRMQTGAAERLEARTPTPLLPESDSARFRPLGSLTLACAGLTYGFTALGDQTGTTLPAAFLAVPWLSRSPYYSYAGEWRVGDSPQGGVLGVWCAVFTCCCHLTRTLPS